MTKLKPVVFVKGAYGYTAQNTAQQLMLLKAMKVTQDPKKLRDLIGVKTVADVYRTLDKIAMRKEYHKSLAKLGITFDYIVGNLKNEIDNAEKSGERLMAINILMKSIGLDKYEESAISGGNWEEQLLSAATKEPEAIKPMAYEVKAPEMPEDVRREKEKKIKEGRSLYE